MNPHDGIRPSDEHGQEFEEVLEDFDQHCHDRVALDPNAWNTPVPVRLLNASEQTEFQQTLIVRDAPKGKYEGAPALYAFTEVYFNREHTLALLYATHDCGMLCGEGFWVVLALENGEWKRLRWRTPSWIS